MMMKLELTEDQRKKLAPFFAAIRKNNENGIVSAIAAQIWEDGAVVKLMVGERGEALAKTLGGSWDEDIYSADERIEMYYANRASQSTGDSAAEQKEPGNGN